MQYYQISKTLKRSAFGEVLKTENRWRSLSIHISFILLYIPSFFWEKNKILYHKVKTIVFKSTFERTCVLQWVWINWRIKIWLQLYHRPSMTSFENVFLRPYLEADRLTNVYSYHFSHLKRSGTSQWKANQLTSRRRTIWPHIVCITPIRWKSPLRCFCN